MADSQPVRVVVIRGGRIRPTEFALRRGESGLSLFACESDEHVRMVVEAVRAAGKSGPLAAAAVAEDDLLALGLELIQTPGGTPDPRVNDLHVGRGWVLTRQTWRVASAKNPGSTSTSRPLRRFTRGRK